MAAILDFRYFVHVDASNCGGISEENDLIQRIFVSIRSDSNVKRVFFVGVRNRVMLRELPASVLPACLNNVADGVTGTKSTCTWRFFPISTMRQR
jgi:hypothetical protein